MLAHWATLPLPKSTVAKNGKYPQHVSYFGRFLYEFSFSAYMLSYLRQWSYISLIKHDFTLECVEEGPSTKADTLGKNSKRFIYCSIQGNTYRRRDLAVLQTWTLLPCPHWRCLRDPLPSCGQNWLRDILNKLVVSGSSVRVANHQPYRTVHLTKLRLPETTTIEYWRCLHRYQTFLLQPIAS